MSRAWFNGPVYERFFEKWFGIDPARERDNRLPDDPMVWIGGQIRAARVHASLTQRQVEDLTGIDQTTISRLENGRGSRMRLDRFAALLVAIDGEIRPADRSLPAWLAPILHLDADDEEESLNLYDLDDPDGR